MENKKEQAKTSRTYSLTIEQIENLAQDAKKLKKFTETAKQWPVLTAAQLYKSIQ